jgi:hypothetical protein
VRLEKSNFQISFSISNNQYLLEKEKKEIGLDQELVIDELIIPF